jgi:acetyl esterase/lipase
MYTVPSLAKDLGGLPPTFIDVGDADVFRDEDVDYTTALW